MLAVTVTPGGSPALRELPSPTAPPGGILVRVRACGLCGSDVEKLRPGGAAAGSVLGHEIAGVVVEGALPAGLRVALAHHVPAATARCCAGRPRAALPRVRRERARAGRVLRADGRLGRRTSRTPLLPLPDHVSDLAGSFVEPLGLRAARHRGAAGRCRWWPARARSACSPPRRCARAARTCACSSPIRAARGAPPSWASTARARASASPARC